MTSRTIGVRMLPRPIRTKIISRRRMQRAPIAWATKTNAHRNRTNPIEPARATKSTEAAIRATLEKVTKLTRETPIRIAALHNDTPNPTTEALQQKPLPAQTRKTTPFPVSADRNMARAKQSRARSNCLRAVRAARQAKACRMASPQRVRDADAADLPILGAAQALPSAKTLLTMANSMKEQPLLARWRIRTGNAT